jgi:hypothetical protein
MSLTIVSRMRFINLITISAVAASNVAIPTGVVAEKSTVEESSVTTKAPSKLERIPNFFEEWNMVMKAVEEFVEKVADEKPPAVEEYSNHFAPFPGVIGI